MAADFTKAATPPLAIAAEAPPEKQIGSSFMMPVVNVILPSRRKYFCPMKNNHARLICLTACFVPPTRLSSLGLTQSFLLLVEI